MIEWEETTLGEIATIIMGQSPKGEDCNNDTHGLPLLNGPTEFGSRHPFPTQFTTDPKKKALSGDLLFCVRGSTTGRMNWADQNYAIGRGIAAIRAKGGEELQPYIKVIIDQYLKELLAVATGSTFPNISRDHLSTLRILSPPPNVRIFISQIADIFDRKISNLRQQNETLESIAQTLFKHWFVDFEFPNEDGKPYKSSGGEMVRSDLGDIPVGWNLRTLGNVTVTITKGTTPTTFHKQFQDSGINFVKVESITDSHSIDYSKIAYIDESTNQLLKRSILREKDIIYTIAGTIGRYAMVSKTLLPANTNQAVAIIRADFEEVDPEYLLCYFSSKSYQHYLSSRVVQAVQANLSLGILSDSPMVLPNSHIRTKFGRLIKVIFQKKEENQKQIQTLTQTRDRLLPKLMSGQLRIPE